MCGSYLALLIKGPLGDFLLFRFLKQCLSNASDDWQMLSLMTNVPGRYACHMHKPHQACFISFVHRSKHQATLVKIASETDGSLRYAIILAQIALYAAVLIPFFSDKVGEGGAWGSRFLAFFFERLIGKSAFLMFLMQIYI